MKQERESLRRKRSARLAAIQSLYSEQITERKHSIDQMVDTILAQWKDSIASQDDEWPTDDLPEPSLLKRLISGVCSQLETIDPMIEKVLHDDWKIDRMDPVLVACLRCAAIELLEQPNRASAIIIDEYTHIASGFSENPELGFMHSAIQQLAANIRPEESTASNG
ncbi:MAG: hypothetical protein MRY32_02920 [Rickettsiales bacterium]|nr:hypothetical protein [Rickettsiales bacterium]